MLINFVGATNDGDHYTKLTALSVESWILIA